MRFLISLLVLWLILTVIGFTMPSMLWLAIIGAVLFLATAGYAVLRGRYPTSPP